MKRKRQPCVYVIADPRNGWRKSRTVLDHQIFYVGSTGRDFTYRVGQHLCHSASDALNQRIAEIKEAGMQPVFKVIEPLSLDINKTERLIRERYWTDVLRSKGAPLLNYARCIVFEHEKPKPVELLDKECPYCKHQFKPTVSRQRFCTKKCHIAYSGVATARLREVSYITDEEAENILQSFRE